MTDYKKLREDLRIDNFDDEASRRSAVMDLVFGIEELQAENERLKKQLYETVTDRNALKKWLDAAISRMLKMAIEIKHLRGEE